MCFYTYTKFVLNTIQEFLRHRSAALETAVVCKYISVCMHIMFWWKMSYVRIIDGIPIYALNFRFCRPLFCIHTTLWYVRHVRNIYEDFEMETTFTILLKKCHICLRDLKKRIFNITIFSIWTRFFLRHAYWPRGNCNLRFENSYLKMRHF